MNLFKASAVILVGLVTLQLVEACGPSYKYNHPFEITNTNETKELGFIPISSAVKLGAQRGLRECEKQFNKSWLVDWSFIKERVDPELPVFVNTTLPYGENYWKTVSNIGTILAGLVWRENGYDNNNYMQATREAALIHAISSAAIAYELTLKCRHNIPGCKCVRPRYTGRDRNGCGDNFEFGQTQTRRFFKHLEKGNGARTAVNLHNNKVGRKVVRTSQTRWCKCHGLAGACEIKTCYMILESFENITAELKKKYQGAVRVEFWDSKLHERIGDQLKSISTEDRRLVFLQPTPDPCAWNDSVGSQGMFGKTCRSNSTTNSDCKSFIARCKFCNLKHTTVVKFEQCDCNCKFHWCCYVKCQRCSRLMLVTTCVANHEKRGYSKISHDQEGSGY